MSESLPSAGVSSPTLEHWGLAREPFAPVLHWPNDQSLVYPSRGWQEALARIHYVAEYQFGLALVTGLPGCGKSLTLAAAADQLSFQNFRPLLHACQPSAAASENPFGLSRNSETRHLMAACNGDELPLLVGRRYVLLLDDVDRIPSQIDALRQVINRGLQLQLVGCIILAISQQRAPELFDVLADYAPLLVRLPSLEDWETAEFLEHRFVAAGGSESPFTDQACELIHEYSQGSPRWIARLAHECLLLGTVQHSARVEASHVTETFVGLKLREKTCLPTPSVKAA